MSKQVNSAITAEKIRSIADAVGATYDGGDSRIFHDSETITVYCNLLDAKTYARMEREIRKAVIKRAAYTVYAWNDASGFKYWHEVGKTGDSNYIQVTADIKDARRVKPEQLKRDLDRVFGELCHWHNVNAYCTAVMNERETKETENV